MEFALMTEPHLGGSYQQLLTAARFAESAGMAAFARSDHFYSDRTPVPSATEAFTTLAGLARETRRIRLVVLVTPITFRHPAVIAKAAATLDEMSGGRFDLGIGTGWMEHEHEAFGLPFPSRRERFDRLEETLRYLEVAFRPGGGSYRGAHYRIDAQPKPVPSNLGIIVGGSGPERTPRLAGRFADEYNHFVASPRDISPKVATMRAAAEQAGRDPDSIRVSVMGPVLTGEDEAAYRERLKRMAAGRGRGPLRLEERWSDAGIPLGPPERVAETLAALRDIGVSRYYLQWLDLTDLPGLESTWRAVQLALELIG